MYRLDLKVPPPAVVLVCAAAMWLLAERFPAFTFELPGRTFVCGAFALAGIFFDVSGFLAFRRMRTTINPLTPHNTSAMVSHAIYRHTRNPMYMGQLLILAAWAVWLCNWLAFPLLPVFVGYLTRFQIIPEERVLAAKFGDAYAEYRQRVPRWF